MKRIPREERLIAALDVASAEQAKSLVECLGDSVRFYKVGWSCSCGRNVRAHRLVNEKGNRVFTDLKFFDIPRPWRGGARPAQPRLTFATVHGNQAMLEAAGEAKGRSRFSRSRADQPGPGRLDDLGFRCDVEKLVLSRARRALEAGCDGVIASGSRRGAERELGSACWSSRRHPACAKPPTTTRSERRRGPGFRHGADYIVVGRPIRQAAIRAPRRKRCRRRSRACFPAERAASRAQNAFGE